MSLNLHFLLFISLCWRRLLKGKTISGRLQWTRIIRCDNFLLNLPPAPHPTPKKKSKKEKKFIGKITWLSLSSETLKRNRERAREWNEKEKETNGKGQNLRHKLNGGSKTALAFIFRINLWVRVSVTRKKSPNIYKSCPKIFSLEKWLILKP